MDVLSRCLQAPIPDLGQNKPNFLDPNAPDIPPPAADQPPAEQQVGTQSAMPPGGEMVQQVVPPDVAMMQQQVVPPGSIPIHSLPPGGGYVPYQMPQQQIPPGQQPSQEDDDTFAEFQQGPARTPQGPPPKSGKHILESCIGMFCELEKKSIIWACFILKCEMVSDRLF